MAACCSTCCASWPPGTWPRRIGVRARGAPLILVNGATRTGAHTGATPPGPHAMTMHFRLRFALGLALGLLAAIPGAAGAQATPPADGLRPGQFTWTPELAPAGPVAVIISLPEQRAYVYRNGVRIGTSTTSTGKPGHATPPGIYTILQKRREHYSNLYDDAPMPFMQRLTWDGVALHAGNLPGYPASHGCVRLPLEFAEQLFATTGIGSVVVVADAASAPPSLVSPGLFAPIDSTTGSPRAAAPPPRQAEWFPQRAPSGPLTILLSTSDRQVLVLRNAVEIGRAALLLDDTAPAIGTRAYLLLHGSAETAAAAGDAAGSDRPAARWQALSVPGANGLGEDALRELFRSQRIALPEAFARALQAQLQPGTSVLLTDRTLQPRGTDGGILSIETGEPEPPPPVPADQR